MAPVKSFLCFFFPILLDLANSAPTLDCPCEIVDCTKKTKSDEQCVCENQNKINKYFCCDGNVAPPTNLGLQSCEKFPLVPGPFGLQDHRKGRQCVIGSKHPCGSYERCMRITGPFAEKWCELEVDRCPGVCVPVYLAGPSTDISTSSSVPDGTINAEPTLTITTTHTQYLQWESMLSQRLANATAAPEGSSLVRFASYDPSTVITAFPWPTARTSAEVVGLPPIAPLTSTSTASSSSSDYLRNILSSVMQAPTRPILAGTLLPRAERVSNTSTATDGQVKSETVNDNWIPIGTSATTLIVSKETLSETTVDVTTTVPSTTTTLATSIVMGSIMNSEVTTGSSTTTSTSTPATVALIPTASGTDPGVSSVAATLTTAISTVAVSAPASSGTLTEALIASAVPTEKPVDSATTTDVSPVGTESNAAVTINDVAPKPSHHTHRTRTRKHHGPRTKQFPTDPPEVEESVPAPNPAEEDDSVETATRTMPAEYRFTSCGISRMYPEGLPCQAGQSCINDPKYPNLAGATSGICVVMNGPSCGGMSQAKCEGPDTYCIESPKNKCAQMWTDGSCEGLCVRRDGKPMEHRAARPSKRDTPAAAMPLATGGIQTERRDLGSRPHCNGPSHLPCGAEHHCVSLHSGEAIQNDTFGICVRDHKFVNRTAPAPVVLHFAPTYLAVVA